VACVRYNPATRNRTREHLIAAAFYSQMLYQLSYSRLACSDGAGFVHNRPLQQEGEGGCGRRRASLIKGRGVKSIFASDDLAGKPASVRTKGRALSMIHLCFFKPPQRLYDKLRYSLAG
jgi:hypothetical protein